MNYRNTPNENGETITAEDLKLQQMIGGLKRVEAPKDFDFRLKARIANYAPPASQAILTPLLRYVLPLGVAAVIIAFVVINSVYFIDNQTVPNIAENAAPTAVQPSLAPPVEPSSVIAQNEPEITTPIENTIPVGTNVKTKKPVAASPLIAAKSPVIDTTETAPEKITGGSRDSASRVVVPINPPGIPTEQKPQTAPINQDNTSLTVKQVLAELGVEVISENGAHKVNSVRANSLGDKSGVKVGDVIEAVDGAKISDAPLNSKTVEVKKLTVTRGTEKVEISFHN